MNRHSSGSMEPRFNRNVRSSRKFPRAAAKQEESLARAHLAYRASIQELESVRRQRQVELERTREQYQELQQKLSELRQERKRVVLKSPIDGILLHGKLNRGKLGEKPSVLQVGSRVTAEQVVATIVNPDKLRIRVDLPQQHLTTVTKGSKCKVTLQGFPDFETVGKVKSRLGRPLCGDQVRLCGHVPTNRTTAEAVAGHVVRTGIPGSENRDPIAGG